MILDQQTTNWFDKKVFNPLANISSQKCFGVISIFLTNLQQGFVGPVYVIQNLISFYHHYHD